MRATPTVAATTAPRDEGVTTTTRPSAAGHETASDVDDAAIAVTALVKRYGDVVAVDHLDLAVRRGELFALLGANGAGKTTTIECCEGFRHPDGGRVRVLGLDPHRDAARLRPRVGMMLQEGGVYPLARPPEVLRLFASFHRVHEDPEDLLARVGLGDVRRTPYRALSGGQKQRLALALALVGRPEVVFLDEPTAGLDPAARRVTWDLVRDLRDRGVTVVLTTHLLDEAELLADRVAIIDRGRLVALGTPQQLTLGEHPELVVTVAGHLDAAALARHLGHAVIDRGGGSYAIEAPNTPELVHRLAAWLDGEGITLGQLQAAKRSLEDVFLSLTGATAVPAPTDAPGGGR